MDKISISTIAYKGNFIYVSDEQAKTFKPEVIKVWEFDCAPFLAETVIQIGRSLNALQLTNERGIGDRDALDMARAKFAALLLVKSWNRTTETGDMLPVNTETVGSVPGSVLLAFYVRAERGQQPTLDEIEAMKKPTSPSTKPTGSDEG